MKKALSLIHKLKDKVVYLQGDFKIVGYRSGHNEMNFFRYILDGMYSLDQEEKRLRAQAVIDKNQQQSGSLVTTPTNLSQPAAPSVPTTIQGNNGFVQTLQGGDNSTVSNISSRGYLNDKDTDWEPWNGVTAPDGWYFDGWMTFVCMGPTTDCEEVLLKMSGYNNETSNGRANQQEMTNKRESFERGSGGPGRGMNLQTKVGLAAVAQGEDDADMRDNDRELASITQQLSSYQQMMTMYFKLCTSDANPVMRADYLHKAQAYEKKVLSLNADLQRIATRKRKKNPIVWQVLDHGAKALGVHSEVDSSKGPSGNSSNTSTSLETEQNSQDTSV